MQHRMKLHHLLQEGRVETWPATEIQKAWTNLGCPQPSPAHNSLHLAPMDAQKSS